MNLYPLKFRPILKTKIWGGQKLKKYGKQLQGKTNIGESWELSGVHDNVSVVANGFLADNELNDLLEVYMSDLVGDSVYELFGNQFPLLFKFIDANHDLSIQVHPDDDTALTRHNSMGKTEMWYVMDVEDDATLTVGFADNCDKQTYLEALQNDKVESLLKKIRVKKGDVIFIHPGLIHSIGKGILLAEIQQASDITYRIYDYNRKDENGKTRELHTDLALDIIDFSVSTPQIDYTLNINGATNLVQCPYFTTNIISLNRTIQRDYAKLDSFVVYLCLEGSLLIETESEPCTLQKGETVLIPAVLNDVVLRPTSQEVKILEVYMDQIDQI